MLLKLLYITCQFNHEGFRDTVNHAWFKSTASCLTDMVHKLECKKALTHLEKSIVCVLKFKIKVPETNLTTCLEGFTRK